MNESNINSKKSIVQNIKNFKIYLNERFPLGKNSFFVLIFTLSGYIYTGLLYNSKIIKPILSKEVNRVALLWDKEIYKVPIIWYKFLPLFIIIFMFFFQLRITDEFKDYEEDLKYRPYRPVQRGIISLKALGKIGIATIIIQIILAHVINPKLIYFMLLVWVYMFLMTKEFFIKNWLTERILIYALSHVVIMIFITLVIVKGTGYILESHFLETLYLSVEKYGKNIFIGLIPLFTLNYLNGIVLKIGIATIIIQIILAHVINPKLIYFMLLVWVYMFLMTKEFFIKNWLTERILIYALSHVVIMIFITLVIVKGTGYILESHFLETLYLSVEKYGKNIFIGLIPLFTLNYLNGIVLEIGRKTRKSDEEEHGVQTYSKLWGREKAVVILCMLYAIEYILVLFGLLNINKEYFLAGQLILTITLALSVYFMIKFLKKDLTGKIPENISGLWILLSSMNLGLIQYAVFYVLNLLKS